MSEADTGGMMADDGAELPDLDPAPVAAEGGQSSLLDQVLKDIQKSEAPKKQAKKPEAVSAQEDNDESSHEEDEPVAQAPAKKVFKAKANGKEYQYTEDKIESVLSRGLAAQQNWEKGQAELKASQERVSQLEKQYLERTRALDERPEEYLAKHKDVAEKLLLAEAEEYLMLQKLPPEAREQYQARKAAEEKLKGFEAKQKEAEKAEQAQLVETQKTQLAAFLSEGMSKHGLPQNTLTMRMMAGVAQAAANKGVEISSEKAAQLVRGHLQQAMKASYTKDSVQTFVDDHPELAEAVRDHYVKKSRTVPAEIEDVRPGRTSNGQFTPRAASKDKDPFEEIERFKKQAEKERSKIGNW